LFLLGLKLVGAGRQLPGEAAVRPDDAPGQPRADGDGQQQRVERLAGDLEGGS